MLPSIVDALWHWADKYPDRVAFTALDGAAEERSWTWGRLAAEARAVASALRKGGLERSRVVITCDQDLYYISSFLGCMAAGAVAVPAYAPLGSRMRERLASILRDCGPRALLTQERHVSRLTASPILASALDEVELIAADQLPAVVNFERLTHSDNAVPAMIQYTSGSTSQPRGVMVSRENIAYNERAIQRTFEQSRDSVIVSWLPFFHDMGLVGVVLQTVYTGSRCVFLKPEKFLHHPIAWLRAIQNFKACTAGAPNFAFDLCTDRIAPEDRETLDLSTWRIAFNGAERVRKRTLDRFAAAFASAGFRRNAFRPCFGLAEATLLVSSSDAQGEHEAVSLGHAVEGTRVVVVDPQTSRPCEDGREGEIWISGPGVALGYWNNPEATSRTFHATTSTGSDIPFLRTGDLGCIIRGNLYFTGRIKDVIVIRGENHAAEDLEETVEATVGKPGGCVALPIEDEESSFGLIVEHDGPAQPDLGRSIEQAILDRHGILPAVISVVRPRAIPRTTSGKVRRSASRPLLSEGPAVIAIRRPEARELEQKVACTVPADFPLSETEAYIRRQVARILKVPEEQIPLDQSLRRLGLDSVGSMRLVCALQERFGSGISIDSLRPPASISALVKLCRDRDGLSDPDAEPERSPDEASAAQQELYVFQRRAPSSYAYHISAAVRLPPNISTAGFKAAVTSLARRHRALRMAFEERDGAILTRCVRDFQPDFIEEGAISGGALSELLAARIRRPFHMDAGPPWRVHLFNVDGRLLALVVLHHIIADGWSLNILVRDLANLLHGTENEDLEALPLRNDPIVPGGRITSDEALRYWARLAEGTEPLRLPACEHQPAASEDCDRIVTRLGPALLRRLTALARFCDTTLFVALLGAFDILLHRHSGQTDFVLGFAANGRANASSANEAGYFVDLLLHRHQNAFRMSLPEFLRAIDDSIHAASIHSGGAAAVWSPPRAVVVMHADSSTPTGEMAAVAMGLPGFFMGAGNVELEFVELPPVASPFELVLSAGIVRGELALSLQYRSCWMDRSYATRMIRHYCQLLSGMADSESRRIGEIEMIDEEERARLIAASRGGSSFEIEGNLTRAFVRQASRREDAVAVCLAEERWSYRDLNQRANQLARYLQRLGVLLESPVGICLERSVDLVVTILAVLKAGGYYVALDPVNPAERLKYFLADSGAKWLVTNHKAVFESPDLRIVDLDAERKAIGAESSEDVDSDAGPANLAYLIYTSGSTGQPKGCAVTHGNVLRLFQATESEFGFGEHDVWTLFHSYAFDFSVWELWGALLYGGRLVVTPHWVCRTPEAFDALIRREGITVLNQTPTAFLPYLRHLQSQGWPKTSLRYVIFGGEALDPRALQPWVEAWGDEECGLINMYGITETTVHVTFRRLTRADVQHHRSRIGRAIGDLELFVLDEQMEPVSEGVAGELYVGGAGLARGYLGRPDLTAERFVPHPFAISHGERLYRSGDRVRWLDGLELEYLGRNDRQIKIRGHRLELAEIERALCAISGVQEAVVTASGTVPDGARLAAYVTGETSVADIRESLHRILPGYMIPSAIIRLDRMPLTENGKLDRKALPEPELAADPSFESPVTGAERVIAEIWQDVLRVSPVGRRDNFFALGGDSIRAIEVKARAAAAGLDLSIQEIFESPALERLASCARSLGNNSEACTLELPDGAKQILAQPEVEDVYPLTAVQSGLIFHSHQAGDFENYVTSLHVRTCCEETALRDALNELVARHPILRTHFEVAQLADPVQIVRRAGLADLRIEDLRALGERDQEEYLARFLQRERLRQIDWAAYPIVRFFVHRRSEDRFQFTLSEPLLDGWSVGTLIAEAFQLYRNRLSPGTLTIPPPPRATFRDYVAAEKRAAGSVESAEFWSRKLEEFARGEIPMLRSTDTQPAPTPVGRSHLALSAELSHQLKERAASAGYPLKSVLLAAHLRVIGIFTGCIDVTTGLLYHGRPETADGERVLGLFVNTVPLRLGLRNNPWDEFIKETYEAEREVIPHRRYPFSEIRKQQGTELFDTVFNYTHFHVYRGMRAIPGVEILASDASEQTYFPLTVQWHLDDETGGIRLAADYQQKRFSAAQAQSLLGTCRHVLETIIASPGRAVRTSCPLPEGDRKELLHDWNRTHRDWQAPETLDALLLAQMQRTPEACAVVFGGKRLTYRELRESSNRLAGLLHRSGLQRGAVVGVCLERSLDLVVALVAIMRAGAAYMPLDPGWPPERVASLIRETSASLILTNSSLERRLVDVAPRKVLALDLLANELSAEKFTDPAVHILPLDAAYVIPTSGSTGQPKGPVNTHGGIVNRLLWMQEMYRLSSADAVLQKTPFTFDVSVWEFFWPLVAGARLVLARPMEHFDAAAMARTIAEHGITVLHFVPVMLRQFLDETGGAGCASLSHVICSGEALSPDLRDHFFSHLPKTSLHNLYGPTEAAIDVTFHECRRMDPSDWVPIGKPIANTQIYILDRDLHPVPPGITGEIYLGGAGLARCYVGRPELTAAAFVPNPFGQPGTRLYRTGDLARFSERGDIELLGRRDTQVKIRGQRIELREIETALRGVPSIRDAVVAAVHAEDGQPRLAAFVLLNAGMSVTEDRIRAHLLRQLPRHMVPGAFQFVDHLPTTASGKVDRKGLAAAFRENQRLEELLSTVESMSDEQVRQLLVRAGTG